MATDVVSAEYVLPHHIWVSPDVLDATYDTFIGPVRATIFTPRRSDPAGVTVHPDLAGIPDTAWSADDEWTTNYAAFARTPMTALRRIGLELREDGRTVPAAYHHANQPHRVKVRDVAADCIEQWFLLVANWVSVITGEDIDHRHPIYDASTIGPGLNFWGHGKWDTAGFRASTPNPTALSRNGFQAVLDAVAAFVAPPVEHQLIRDSIAACKRNDLRKAVLDAATAVEVCLIRRIKAIETACGEKCPGRGLGSRSNWLDEHDADYVAPDGLKELGDLRNAVIHAGDSPSDYNGVANVVRTAIAVGEKLGRSRIPTIPPTV